MDEDFDRPMIGVASLFIVQTYTMALAPGVDPLRDADHTIFFRAKKVWSGNSSNRLPRWLQGIPGLFSCAKQVRIARNRCAHESRPKNS